jgi:hypothetical protein
MNPQSEQIPPDKKPPTDTAVGNQGDYYAELWNDMENLDKEQMADLIRYLRNEL